ncbi:MAG: PIN domain-containing protein [Phycisphaerales bacterium]
MVLIDTSVWISHFRARDAVLAGRIVARQAVTHPFVIGELAAGQIPARTETLLLLSRLPGVILADHDDVMMMVEAQRLYGRGLSWVDLHLLASARLSRVKLHSLDRKLMDAADALGVRA